VTRRALRATAAIVLTLGAAAGYGTSRRALPVRAEDEPHPPALLSETGLYVAGQPGVVDPRNRPFAPQYPLWTDGASKRRWVYLPERATIDASDAFAWRFPVGTRFWKEFAFGGREVETRMLWKATSEAWITASYVWNDDQTDALLAPEAGVPGAAEIAPGRRHSIPARADCAACHGAPARPLGFGALQLSTDRDPNAIHGEPLAPGMLTLATLVEEGRLAPDRSDLVAAPPRISSRDPRTRAALGYLAANCGHCHERGAEIGANLKSLGYEDVTADGDAVALSLVGQPTRWQVPGLPDGASVVVDPAAPDESALLARMRSRRPSSQMPPLGTVIRDQRALDAIADWIATDLARARAAGS
jgi:cytochrome c553